MSPAAKPNRKNAHWMALGALVLPLIFSPAQAMDGGDDAAGAQVPARIRAMEGSPLIQREREMDRVEGSLNMPIYPADQIISQDGRLELQLPDGTLLWVAPETRFEAAAWLDSSSGSEDSTVLRLHEGIIEIDFDTTETSDFRIDTPEASVYLLGAGRYRIETENGTTEVISRRGTAELSGEEGSVLVRSGQRARLNSGYGPEEPRSFNTMRLDEFDAWCDERAETYIVDNSSDDRPYVQEVPVPVRHYVSELDHYGNWQYMVDFGWVWRPTVYQVGWRPYYSGYWASCRWGWSWVSYEPWGWVPYHYGRWSWAPAAGWVWIPGGVYANAWVGWAVTPTYIGWCPLDYYNRPVYIQTNINNVYVNHYGGGWNFLPLNRWGYRDLQRSIIRADRVPELQGAVATRTLPHFRASEVRARPEVLQKVIREKTPIVRTLPAGPRVENGPRLSFREADHRESIHPPESRSRTMPSAGQEFRSGKMPPRMVRQRQPAGVNTEVEPPSGYRPVVRPGATAPERSVRGPQTVDRGTRNPRRLASELPEGTPGNESSDPSQRVLRRILSSPAPGNSGDGSDTQAVPDARGRGPQSERAHPPGGSGVRKDATGRARPSAPSASRQPAGKTPPGTNPKPSKDPRKDKP